MESLIENFKTPNLLEKINSLENAKDKTIFLLRNVDEAIFPGDILEINDLASEDTHKIEHSYEINKDGKIIEHSYRINSSYFEKEKPTNHEIISLVLHELRHRIQLQKGIAFFSIENTNSLPLEIKNKIEALPQEIKIKQKELDAKIVEFILLHLFGNGWNIEELIPLLKEEPEALIQFLGKTIK